MLKSHGCQASETKSEQVLSPQMSIEYAPLFATWCLCSRSAKPHPYHLEVWEVYQAQTKAIDNLNIMECVEKEIFELNYAWETVGVNIVQELFDNCGFDTESMPEVLDNVATQHR